VKSVAQASLLLATVVFWPGCDSPQKAESLVANASKAMEEQDFARLRSWRSKRATIQHTGPGLRIAGDAALQQKAIDRAFDHFARIPKDDSVNRAHGCVRTAQFLVVDKGQLRRAERKFREALSLQPTNEAALDGLSFLLTITARRWESAPSFCAWFSARVARPDTCWESVCLNINSTSGRRSNGANTWPPRSSACARTGAAGIQ